MFKNKQIEQILTGTRALESRSKKKNNCIFQTDSVSALSKRKKNEQKNMRFRNCISFGLIKYLS